VEHIEKYFQQVSRIAESLDQAKVNNLVGELKSLRERKGRLFFLGVGGSAANCSHAVNDFRKLCGIEAYSPVDNVSELTARTNDDGWDTVFEAWLKISNANKSDAVMIFSVGGGDAERNVSANLIKAIVHAKDVGMKVFGVVGKDSGHTAKVGDVVVVIPQVDPNLITPHSEAFQAVVWHCLVSHPDLQIQSTKW